MRSDGMLSYEFSEEPGKAELTGHAGLLPYIDLACILGLLKEADDKIGVCGAQGWMDRQHVLSLILLNLAGGERVEDINMLESDEGLCRIFGSAESYGLSRADRRSIGKRFRKGRTRTFPSPTRLYEYLDEFHNAAEEEKRVEGKAFIPEKNAHLKGIGQANAALVASVQKYGPAREATLDIDATIQETTKRESLYCYEGHKAYQPITTYWAETGLAVMSEFRDGNVPAGHEILRILKESLLALPAGIEKVRVRMDSAGYQHDVLKYCATGDSGRREVIEFTVSCDMTAEFRKAASQVDEGEWNPLYKEKRGKQETTGQEWAEVVYVPNVTATAKHEAYRYIAIREVVRQGVLPGMDEIESQIELPSRAINCKGRTYKLRGIVTNRDGEGEDLIHWHRERCGKSEEAHAIMKIDLAGGCFPSGKFGANAAWWGIMLLAYNLHAAMQRLAFTGPMKRKRMKAVRFALIDVPARIVEHGRQLYVRLSRGHPALAWLQEIRQAIRELKPVFG